MLYEQLVGVCRQLEATSKRLEKIHLLSDFLKNVSVDDLEEVLLLLQGRIFPQWDSREIGVAAKLVVKAISKATGITTEEVEHWWKKTGDLGRVAEDFCRKKVQATLSTERLTVTKVLDNLRKAAETGGTGAVERKIAFIGELLANAAPLEAKYVIRTVLGELRVGLGEGTVRDAIVWAFFSKEAGVNYNSAENDLMLSDEQRQIYNAYVAAVQEAYDVANDFGSVAATAKRQGLGGLKNIALIPGKPIKAMLYQKAKDIAEGFAAVGKPCAVEYKFDGFRLQIHKANGRIKLFTRRLEEVTAQFPDVVKAAAENVSGNEFILDAEVVGYERGTGKYLPFQSISQRIKRKYEISGTAARFPVEVNVFDIMFLDGRNALSLPYAERRKLIEAIVMQQPLLIKVAEQCIVAEEEAAEEFYKRSLAAGNEGIMMKNLSGVYKPGSRVGFGVKVKPVMETLEVVIVGGEWGEGKRANWISSFVIAVKDAETGEFLEIGRMGTGIKEKDEEGVSFGMLTELLSPLIVAEAGREVKIRQSVVVEVDYEEIQKSPTYKSGFALRFPRFVRLREDRSAEEISTVEDVRQLFDSQRSRG